MTSGLEPDRGQPTDTISVVEHMAATNPEVVGFQFAARDDRRYAAEFVLPSAVVDSLIEIRQRQGIPFWEAALIATERLDLERIQSVLDAASYHRPPAETVTVSAKEVRDGYLRLEASRLKFPPVWDLVSSVRMADGHGAHLQLLDFRLPISQANEQVAGAICRRVAGGPGFLLDSGDSYHYIGTLPVPTCEWLALMGRALLFAPHVDTRWVGHRLIEGRGAVRASSSSKHAFVPRVLRAISEDY